MNNNVESLFAILDDVKTMAPKATETEALAIAVQIQRNQILQAGLNVSYSDSHPASLEAIAIALGFAPQLGYTVTDALTDLVRSQSKE